MVSNQSNVSKLGLAIIYLYGYLEQGKTQKEKSIFGITYSKNDDKSDLRI